MIACKFFVNEPGEDPLQVRMMFNSIQERDKFLRMLLMMAELATIEKIEK